MGRTNWKTVEGPARIEYEVKKSVFIADVAPVTSGEEATDFIRRIKKEFPDARHHVYAYRTGDEVVEQRYSDDGEPSGTAGMPVLDVILRQDLSDVVIVVTRYFGGILLGTGGLTRAYSTSASMGVSEAKVCTMEMLELFHAKTDYSLADKLRYAAEKQGYVLGDMIYEDRPILPLACRKEEKDALLTFINDVTAARAEVSYQGTRQMKT